jgi:YHS domain-containing protein
MNTQRTVCACASVALVGILFLTTVRVPVPDPGGGSALPAVLRALELGPAPAFAEAEKTQQTKCPVMGGAIDRSAYVDYKGKRVYFCCPGCKETFLKEPDRYIQKMESEGIVLEKTPKEQP